MEQYRQLSSHRHHCSFLAIFSSALRKLQPPSPQITVLSKWPQNVMCCLHQHRSQISVSCFGDLLLWLALPGVPASRPQPQKTADLATLRETVGVFYRRDIRQRDLGSYSLHLLEQFDLRVTLVGDFLHPLVVFLNALVQRFDFFE